MLVYYEVCCAGTYLLSCLLMYLVYGEGEVEDEKGSYHLLFLFFQSSRQASSTFSHNQRGGSCTHSCNFASITFSGTSGMVGYSSSGLINFHVSYPGMFMGVYREVCEGWRLYYRRLR